MVDSTAAPVAGLALVSTWVAVEIEYVAEGLRNLDPALGLKAFPLFVASIPYRFYVLMALVFVPLVALLQRDFGPMLSAERNRIRGDTTLDYPDLLASPYPTEPAPSTPARWYNAVLPIGLTVAVVVWLMIATGISNLPKQPGESMRFGDICEVADLSQTLQFLGEVLSASDSSLALQYGALAGLGLASVMALSQRLLTRSQVVAAAGAGARLMLPAIAILWLASTVSRMTGNTSADGADTVAAYQYQDHRLYTGEYLQSLLGENESRRLTEPGDDNAGAATSVCLVVPHDRVRRIGHRGVLHGHQLGHDGNPDAVNRDVGPLAVGCGGASPILPVIRFCSARLEGCSRERSSETTARRFPIPRCCRRSPVAATILPMFGLSYPMPWPWPWSASYAERCRWGSVSRYGCCFLAGRCVDCGTSVAGSQG